MRWVSTSSFAAQVDAQVDAQVAEADTEAAVRPVSPAASRIVRRRWQDPRLWIGVLLVAGATLAGGRLLSDADDTTPVWRLTHDLRAGTSLADSDLEPVDVRLPEDLRERYLPADLAVAGGLSLTRDVRAGELVAAADLTDAWPAPSELPLLVPAGGFPGELGVGDLVDVWVTGAPDHPGRTELVVEGVRVTTVSSDDLAGVGADRAVTVALPPEVEPAAVLEQLGRGSVVLLRVGG